MPQELTSHSSFPFFPRSGFQSSLIYVPPQCYPLENTLFTSTLASCFLCVFFFKGVGSSLKQVSFLLLYNQPECFLALLAVHFPPVLFLRLMLN